MHKSHKLSRIVHESVLMQIVAEIFSNKCRFMFDNYSFVLHNFILLFNWIIKAYKNLRKYVQVWLKMFLFLSCVVLSFLENMSKRNPNMFWLLEGIAYIYIYIFFFIITGTYLFGQYNCFKVISLGLLELRSKLGNNNKDFIFFFSNSSQSFSGHKFEK